MAESNRSQSKSLRSPGSARGKLSSSLRPARRRGLRFEPLEVRQLLANLGLGIRLVEDNSTAASPASSGNALVANVNVGNSFWIEIVAQDIRTGRTTTPGIIALPLNISWDPSVVQYDALAMPNAAGGIPDTSPLITSSFPRQRGLLALSLSAGPVNPAGITAGPNSSDQLQPFTNLTGVSGGAFPAAGIGSSIGTTAPQYFSRIKFTLLKLNTAMPFTIGLAGGMSFADANVLEGITPLLGARTFAAAPNTVEATVTFVGGQKFDDLNGSGSRDTNEPGIPNVTIQLDNTATRTTGANGFYSFGIVSPNPPQTSYQLCETTPVGTVPTFPLLNGNCHAFTIPERTGPITVTTGNNISTLDFGNTTPVTISGTKFNDLNGDGNLVGDPMLAGVQIELLNNGGQRVTLPNNGPNPATTDQQGRYQFVGVAPGTYNVREITRLGTVPTFPNRFPATVNEHIVTVTSGTNLTNLDFGNTILGSIGGTKFDDRNGNGVRDPGEQTIANVTIRLSQGVNVVNTTTTSATGAYQFTGLFPGTYTITENLPAGTVQTTPVSITIVVQSGDNLTDRDFGNFTKFVASGEKFEDLNGSGTRDAGEPPMAVDIQLLLNGKLEKTQNTGTTGQFQFTDLGPGNYTVREVPPGNGIQTTTPTEYTFTGESGVNRTGLNFGNFIFAEINGIKFEDLNSNGVRDAGDFGRSGVSIELELLNSNPPLRRTTTTDAIGNFSFQGLGPGTYTVREIPPFGSTPTTPTSVTVTVTSRLVRTIEFGNHTEFTSLSGYVFSDTNFNGIIENNEFGLGNWTVNLFDNNGAFVASRITNLSGYYQFNDLVPGTYRLTEVQRPGFSSSSIHVGSVRPANQVRGTANGFNQIDNIVLNGGDAGFEYNFGEIVDPANKRFFLAKTDPQQELLRSSGLLVQSVLGTDGNDTFEVEHLGDSIRVNVNFGPAQTFSVANLNALLLDGGLGNDTLILTATTGDDVVNVRQGQISIDTALMDLLAKNFEDVIADASTGNDYVVIEGSDQADTLNAAGPTATLETPATGKVISASNFDRVRAYSQDAKDTAVAQATDYILERFGTFA